MSETGLRGEAAALLVSAVLSEAGLAVLKPVSDSLPFDLGVYRNGRFYRLQIKRAYPNKRTGSYVIPVRKVNPRLRSGADAYRYTEEHTDFIVGVVMETGDCYFLPIPALTHIRTEVHLSEKSRFEVSSFKNRLVLDTETIVIGRQTLPGRGSVGSGCEGASPSGSTPVLSAAE